MTIVSATDDLCRASQLLAWVPLSRRHRDTWLFGFQWGVVEGRVVSRVKPDNVVVRSESDVVRLGGLVLVGWVVYLCCGARRSAARGVRRGDRDHERDVPVDEGVSAF